MKVFIYSMGKYLNLLKLGRSLTKSTKSLSGFPSIYIIGLVLICLKDSVYNIRNLGNLKMNGKQLSILFKLLYCYFQFKQGDIKLNE